MIKLEDCKESDHYFIYQLIKEFFKKNLNVTYLKMESFDEFTKRLSMPNDKNYIIKDQTNEKLGFVHIMANNEIGYFIVPKFQNKGIGIEAVRLLLDLNPREIYFATIHNDNISSIKLVEKLGFQPKGTIYEKRSD